MKKIKNITRLEIILIVIIGVLIYKYNEQHKAYLENIEYISTLDSIADVNQVRVDSLAEIVLSINSKEVFLDILTSNLMKEYDRIQSNDLTSYYSDCNSLGGN